MSSRGPSVVGVVGFLGRVATESYPILSCSLGISDFNITSQGNLNMPLYCRMPVFTFVESVIKF